MNSDQVDGGAKQPARAQGWLFEQIWPQLSRSLAVLMSSAGSRGGGPFGNHRLECPDALGWEGPPDSHVCPYSQLALNDADGQFNSGRSPQWLAEEDALFDHRVWAGLNTKKTRSVRRFSNRNAAKSLIRKEFGFRTQCKKVRTQ